MVRIRFNRFAPPYTTNDIATFPASKAADIVERELASYEDPPKKGKAQPPASDEGQPSAPEETPKRKRGRPRKASSGESSSVPSEGAGVA
jgi:hypothetical protein